MADNFGQPGGMGWGRHGEALVIWHRNILSEAPPVQKRIRLVWGYTKVPPICSSKWDSCLWYLLPAGPITPDSRKKDKDILRNSRQTVSSRYTCNQIIATLLRSSTQHVADIHYVSAKWMNLNDWMTTQQSCCISTANLHWFNCICWVPRGIH